ncbi:unnamed protein product [Boreogadus saida]
MPPAVGIQMKLDFFKKKFWTASRQCAALDGKCSINCDDENINCYLIDNNGFVLVAEDYTLTGKFFGEAEGAVMNKLLQMGSFKRQSRWCMTSCLPYALTTLNLANHIKLFSSDP